MKNKKILPLLGVLLLLLTSGGLTYAFFQAQSSDPVTRDVHVLTHTVDMLTFSIDADISVEATQLNFTNGGDNQDGEATASAILTPNSKTGTATRNYYLYLNIESNPFVYSAANTNHDPELLLQLFDSSDNLVTLTGLGNQVTIDSLTGYDITTARGLKTLLDNHTITASNNATTTQEWRVVVTLVNLDVNQNDNTGKTFEAELIIQEDELDLGFTGTIYRHNQNRAKNGTTILALNNESVYCAYSSEYDENRCDFSDYRMTQAECESDLLNMWWLSGYVCQQETRSFPGIGEYETNVNTIRTAAYSVYCPIGGDNLTCGNNWYYQSEQECLDDVDTNTYTCTAGSITKPYYLKHVIASDIVDSTEGCLWYNNHEFCIDNWFWDTDGATTKIKLQTAMEAALGTQADGCDSYSNGAYCFFGDWGCSVDSYGYVGCGDDHGGCGVNGTGLSDCD